MNGERTQPNLPESGAGELAEVRRPRQPVTPRRRGGITSRTMMILLGVIAVILIAVGIAAPQVAYAYDADRYDALVDEANDLGMQVREATVERDTAETLRDAQRREAEALVPRLEGLAAADTKILPADRLSAVQDAAEKISAELAETSDPSASRLATLDALISGGDLVAPASWSGADPLELKRVIAERAPDAEVTERDKTVSREVIREVKETTDRHRADLAAAEKRTKAAQAESARLVSALDGAVTPIGDLAAALQTSSDEALQQTLDAETQNESLSAAAASVRSAVDAKDDAFVRLADGGIVPNSEATPLPVGAQPITVDGVARTFVLLSRIEAYVPVAAEALQAQADAEESVLESEQMAAEAAEAAAAEEAARAAEEAAAGDGENLDPAQQPADDGTQTPDQDQGATTPDAPVDEPDALTPGESFRV